MTGPDLLDALADVLADKVAERLAARVAAPVAPALATAKHNPLGSSRAFLDAARAGRFASRRRGREVVADWSDVVAFDVARQRPRTPPASATRGPDADREAALRRAGALKT